MQTRSESGLKLGSPTLRRSSCWKESQSELVEPVPKCSWSGEVCPSGEVSPLQLVSVSPKGLASLWG